MRKLLTLNEDGRLALKGSNGERVEVQKTRPNVLLLIDTSGSMSGNKLQYSKSGAADFSRSAVSKGYSVALAVFADRAAMVCDPTDSASHFEAKIDKIRVGVVGQTTDLASGLILANKFQQLSVVVIVTDGMTEQESALRGADTLKARAVEIICIGTDDADRRFLERLATRRDLAQHVLPQMLSSAIGDASRLLKG